MKIRLLCQVTEVYVSSVVCRTRQSAFKCDSDMSDVNENIRNAFKSSLKETKDMFPSSSYLEDPRPDQQASKQSVKE